MAAYSRFHTPKVSYTQRVNQAMATNTTSMPNPSGRDARQSNIHAATIASAAHRPALTQVIGTGIDHSDPIPRHRLAGTANTGSSWSAALRASADALENTMTKRARA